MPRFNASLLFAFLFWASPAFSAEPPPGTTPQDEIDPETGLARSTVVRPLLDAPAPAQGRPVPPPVPRVPHIALLLPTASPTLGRLADAVRQGFIAAAGVAGREAPPVRVTALENEDAALVEACRHAHASGALIIVGGLTRDGAQELATSDCPRQPVLALNELRGEVPPFVYSISLSLEQEARQAALLAVADGRRSAIVIHTPSALSRRVQEAFEREWTRAAGELRSVVYNGAPEDAGLVRERIASLGGDMVFFALDQTEARAVRPYVSAMLPVYATSLSVNPRAEHIVNLDLQGVRYLEMPWFVQPDHPAVMVYPTARGAPSVEHERLYAFGIDALRLALELLKGRARPTLDGVTGRISLEHGTNFGRALAAVEVDGGRVLPLPAAR